MIDLASGRSDVAVAVLRRVIAGTPDLYEAHRILVLAYAVQGRQPEAQAAVADLSRRNRAEGEKLARSLSRLPPRP
jgi:hypothetical protein